MKKFIKEWFLPPKILDMLYKYYTLSKVYKFDLGVLKKNKSLKNIYQGKRCFILGNAPTIKDIDLTLLENEYVFLMSTFYNHPDYPKLKNTFFSTVQLTANNEKDEFKWLKIMEEKTKTTNTFFFNIAQKKTIEKNNLFTDKEIHYIATANTERSYNICKITKYHPTNIVQALEIAIYMGFTEIFLHSVNINTICNAGKYEYFFDRHLLVIDDPHVNENNLCHDFFLEVESTYHTLNEINIIKKFADQQSVKIFYTNQESLLKFFNYIPFYDAISKNET